MNILVVGGKLQGTEVVYLAKKAGWTVYLVDKNPMAPAINLCDHFYEVNLFNEKVMVLIYKKVDVVIPALEDETCLTALVNYGYLLNKKVIFDIEAFHISSSKSLSNEMFKDNDVPIPRDYEACLAYDLPVVVKPNNSSGSHGVHVFKRAVEAKKFIENHSKYICQEYLEGPSYSLEVIGDGENVEPLIVTQIIIDEQYDCQRVAAPAVISKDIEKEFYTLAEKIAKALQIKGIFDIEVIESKGKLYVLEIDARMPSQTPIAVYHATGINMVKEIVEYAEKPKKIHQIKRQYSILQHLELKEGNLTGIGERVMGKAGPLIHKTNYFGADDAIISDRNIYEGYISELIVTSDSPKKTEEKITETIELIEKKLKIGEGSNDEIKHRQYAVYKRKS